MMSNNNPESTPHTEGDATASERTWTEEIEVAANQVVEQVQSLIREGNVRRLIVKHDGNTVLEVPVTIATVAGLATLYLAPLLAALGALAGLVARVQVVVVREGERNEPLDINPAGTPILVEDGNINTVPPAPTTDGTTTKL